MSETLNATAAAQAAKVTVATIRTWCRLGVVKAAKVAGRWIVQASSLAHRIHIGKARMDNPQPQPLTRAEFEAEAATIGHRRTMNDIRCHGEYRAWQRTGEYGDGTPIARLMVRRGAALAAQGYTPPQRTSAYAGPQDLVDREMAGSFGLPSSAAPGECHYCGGRAATCDCR